MTMLLEESRGVSDSSAALVASSINGGGCLPPPTAAEKVSEALGKHMVRAVNSNDEVNAAGFSKPNYRAALPDSLAWRTSTQTMMVSGLAGEVTEEELAKIPLDLISGPLCQKSVGPVEPRRQRLWHARRACSCLTECLFFDEQARVWS